jgi:protein TonB
MIASLSADTPGERRAYAACLGAALLIHAGSLLWLDGRSIPPKAAPLPATEIELAPPPPPPTAAEAPAPEPAPAPRLKPIPRSKPAPTPAPAPALLTAADHATNDPAPVRFASDPNGRSYTSGLVAANAVARPATAPAAPPAPPGGDRITPADQLERQPLWRGDDCRGYFPEQAQTDLGRVSLIAVVRADGSIARLDVAAETPAGQGFARAARSCLQNQRYAPALDRRGQPTLARTQISLRFSR